MRTALALAALVLAPALAGQAPPANGPATIHPGWHALVGATVVTEPGEPIEDATIVVRDGRITDVGTGLDAPRGARVWDYSGKTIYAAFVDPHVPIEVTTADEPRPTEHWNRNVLPNRTALDDEGIEPEHAATLRGLGFGAAAVAPHDGIFRGSAAVVSLADPRENEPRAVLRRGVYDVIGFTPRTGRDTYPRSQMGVIALLRQTFSDVAWHASDPSDVRPYLDVLATDRPTVIDTRNALEALRGLEVAREFERDAILLGSGLEFRRLDALSAAGDVRVILPLAFPSPPRIESVGDRESVTLRQLLTWEHAPTNPRRLLDNGIEIAITTDKVKPKRFWRNLRRAIRFGLSHDQALAALTTTPARLLGLQDDVGRIAPGYRANLLVLDERLDDEDATRRAIWIDGRHHEIEPEVDLEGKWSAALELGTVQVDGIDFASNEKAKIRAGDEASDAKRVRVRSRQVDLVFDAAPLGGEGMITLSGVVNATRMFGAGVDATGRSFGWSARRTGPLDAEDAEGDEADDGGEPIPVDLAVRLPTPFGAYGRVAPPVVESLRIEDATIWTSGPAGIVEDGVLIVRDGRVEYAGPRAEAPAAPVDRVVDLDGLHVTPGLIDCHSHTGISRGVNEGTQAVTAEVRIADVIDPDDIGWYRELAGGLVAANQLHGSANPIGGQNSVVKLRWGVAHPNDMRVDGAPGGIKFALGENVKQSNWGDRHTTRYPQTRMGVEALMIERFAAAREYDRARQRDPSTRRDLELEALAEILRGERLIHCHSYRQDEILMLCRVAKQFGFRIGTFQHGLECYKVAEAVREVSIGASVFTDWWAYKFEVVDAIPENGAILWETGVPVSFNSDSNELARRMNGEAAKAVKYGGVPRDEALKFVTLVPAMQLGVADRMGSLERGKDADFAIWSGDPLSSMTRCLATYVDGRRYWSIDEDRIARDAAHAERERLIQIVLTLDESEFDDDPSGEDGRTLDNLPGECGCCDDRQEAYR